MLFYRQISVLSLFFIILFLFFAPEQRNLTFIILKGLTLGALIIIFFAYVGPQRSLNKNLNNNELLSASYKQYSSLIKDSYDHLISNSEEIITTMNDNLSVGIYIHDDKNGVYSIQNKTSKNFVKIIDSNNKIILGLIDKKKTQVIKKKNNDTDWQELLIEKAWRGSESIIAVPIIYKEFPIGFVLVFVDHFSKISPNDQLVVEKVIHTFTKGMEELEEIEKLIISNKFNSKLVKLIEQLDITSDDGEFIHSINGICRSFFQYDKLTIAFSNKDNSSADIFLVDGFKEDIDKGDNFEIKNTIHGLAIIDNKTICSNSWYEKFPEMNRFLQNDRDLHSFKSILSVPIRINGKSIGVISLERIEGKMFSAIDINFLESLCGVFSTEVYLKNKYNKVHLSAIHDGLTGLLNHNAFLKRFDEELSRADRFSQSVGLIVLDIDKFKNINDNYGHLYGDYVLKEVSNIISQNVRTIDVVGRYGGEEFSVLLVNTNIDDCIPMAQRIVDKVSNKTFLKDGIASQITISAGMAGFPTHSDQLTNLIEKADKAMYETKSKGGNGVTIST